MHKKNQCKKNKKKWFQFDFMDNIYTTAKAQTIDQLYLISLGVKTCAFIDIV